MEVKTMTRSEIDHFRRRLLAMKRRLGSELTELEDETLRPLDLDYSAETEARFTEIVGGLGVALARSCKIIDPDLMNPVSEHWERSYRIFDLLL
jgi:hypothetical protein